MSSTYEMVAMANGTSLSSHVEAVVNAVVETPRNPYHYVPSRVACIILLAIFAISTGTHVWQAVRYRLWWMFPTAVLCGLMEVIGWGARLWSSFDVFKRMPYIMQTSLTVLAPTPLLAASFIIFAEVIRVLGPAYSRISPRYYAKIFLSCDIIALLVQGAGGGLAASANDSKGAMLGSNIILGGIVFQLIVICVFCAFSIDYSVRYFKEWPLKSASGKDEERGVCTPRMKKMLAGLALGMVALFIRAVYRTIELADGWEGRIMTTEVYFNVLDGAMIVLAICILNIVYPGRYLFQPPAARGDLYRGLDTSAGGAMQLDDRSLLRA
ncbi:RTA1 like protein-domain-containing protein [Ephemerocybe angulata]|uniref:RTA1 like protein-domain-containing protein n=1 Tax=Ephemerocybe angulata TaxID=980116 RepID=A0A8H6HW58_9AGAR|nr:RTA1 like protein-domain-containing protein [Tulosesus angulatus]